MVRPLGESQPWDLIVEREDGSGGPERVRVETIMATTSLCTGQQMEAFRLTAPQLRLPL